MEILILALVGTSNHSRHIGVDSIFSHTFSSVFSQMDLVGFSPTCLLSQELYNASEITFPFPAKLQDCDSISHAFSTSNNIGIRERDKNILWSYVVTKLTLISSQYITAKIFKITSNKGTLQVMSILVRFNFFFFVKFQKLRKLSKPSFLLRGFILLICIVTCLSGYRHF
jgi:hypothetical protein